MSDTPAPRIYVGLIEDAIGSYLSAVTADGDEREFVWAATSRPAEVDQVVSEMLAFAGTREVFVWDSERLLQLMAGPMSSQDFEMARRRVRDLLPAALIVLPDEADYSPRTLVSGLGLDLPDDDEPMGEALVCRALADALHEIALTLRPPVLALLRGLIGSHEQLGWLELSRVELPDITTSALEMLVDGRPKVPAPRKRQRHEFDVPLDALARDLLGEGGPVAAELDAYEHRLGQVEMAEVVAHSLQGGHFLLVEAGTGVGKSLAYLVPGILWSRATAEPLIVSTNTKNLQEQLINKDLPLLSRAMPVEFVAALVKGRSNYVCPRRFLTVMREAMGSLFGDEHAAAACLASWMAASESADLDSVPAEALRMFPPLRGMIGRLRSDRTTCLGPNCPQAKVCPMRVARATGRNADVIVSNHALTLADEGGDVLPPYSRIVFDEAHNLESVATDQLGSEVSSFSFSSLRRTFGGDSRARGLSDALSVAVAAGKLPPSLTEMHQNLAVRIGLLEDASAALGETVIALCSALNYERDGARITVRLTSEARDTEEWDSVAHAAGQCRLLLGEASEILARLVEELRKAGGERSPLADLAMEAASARSSLMELDGDLSAVLTEEDEEAPRYVCWAGVRWRGRGAIWRLCAAPIQIGPVLREAVYKRRASVIMTSATLTVDDSFEYIRQRLGLRDEPGLIERMVPSPFDMPTQLLMCVPDDIPISGEPGYREAIADGIVNIARTVRGGMLVLFTSRKAMDAVFDQIDDRLRDLGLLPLCQHSSGPRSSLLTRMRSAENVVLFGLKSFWEGVDVPGEALRCVVVTKLPFAVPSDPIIEARCEQVNRDGLNASTDYYFPEAIIGFKQGVGRLIRSTSDRGVIFVLDKRIIVRNYGSRFLESVPRGSFATGSFSECLEETHRWFRGGGNITDARDDL